MFVNNRKTLIAKIHIAKTQLAMDDETYRQFLTATVGKASCTVMNVAELCQVVHALEAKGFRPKAAKFKKENRPAPAAEKARYLKKITALLASQGKPQAYADAVAKQAFGVDFVHWLTPRQLHKVVQMLSVYNYRQTP